MGKMQQLSSSTFATSLMRQPPKPTSLPASTGHRLQRLLAVTLPLQLISRLELLISQSLLISLPVSVLLSRRRSLRAQLTWRLTWLQLRLLGRLTSLKVIANSRHVLSKMAAPRR